MSDPTKRSRGMFDLVKFKEAYPQLEDVIFEWTEDGVGVRYDGNNQAGGGYAFKVNAKTVDDFIRCSNLFCKHDSGFDLWLELENMVNNKNIVKEGYVGCQGRERKSKSSRHCANRIKYKITAVYKK